MKRLIICSNTDWYLYNFRLELARFLREQDFEVFLVSPAGDYVSKLTEAGFPWIRWEVGRQSAAPLQEIGAVWRLFRIYRGIKPDLVHHHTIKPVIYGSIAAQLAGISAIVNSITGRGYVFLSEEEKSRQLQRIVLPLYRFALRSRGCMAIFENSADRQFFLENNLIPAGRTWLIESVGIDAEKFTPQPQPDGTPIVLMASRMLWDKGVGDLVEAARILKSQYPLHVVLAGEPDPGNPATIPEESLKEWHREGVVEWLGWQSDMPAVYARSHIVVLPSLYEGMPTTLLEAAASGRPIVATDIPGCRQIVTDGLNGYLVPPRNPQALADALARLLSDPALRGRMGAESRQIVLRKFTHSHINKATLTVYRKSFEISRRRSLGAWLLRR